MTGSPLTCRLAGPSDVPVLMNLIPLALPDHLRPYTIYGCTGIQYYLEAAVAMPPSVGDRLFFVAALDAKPMSALELVRRSGCLFLNHIAVHAAARGLGIGSRLLLHALQVSIQGDEKRFALDVHATNTAAIHWYERMGLKATGSRRWTDSSWPQVDVSAIGRVENGTEAEAIHTRYGFSPLSIATARGHHLVGRLGDRYYRLGGTQPLQDPGCVACMHVLGPERRLLCIDAGEASGTGPPASAIPLGEFRRMEGDLSEVAAHLGSHRH